jgi:hypothetical protein
MSARITNLTSAWHSAKTVRTREKISFFFGVHSLLVSALLFAMAPECVSQLIPPLNLIATFGRWVHVSYTLQALYLLPVRIYKYKKRAWHYFLFDLCYYVTILNFLFIWVFPSSPALFVACYCLSHGSLASAVITWRNSLVFHDSDKVTSLFIHIYAPFTFTTIRCVLFWAVLFSSLTIHNQSLLSQRRRTVPCVEGGTALEAVPCTPSLQLYLYASLSHGSLTSSDPSIDVIWQILYWKFVLVNRRTKIESGQRTTSFSFLLNDKRGVIGRTLSGVPPAYREVSFMGGQLRTCMSTCKKAEPLTPGRSVWAPDGVARGVPVLRQPSMERCVPDPHLRRLSLERWRLLHRGLWPQVRSRSHAAVGGALTMCNQV